MVLRVCPLEPFYFFYPYNIPMKQLFLLLASLMLVHSAFAETIPATDSRVTFVGRAVVEDGCLRFDWPSTYFRIAFTGKKLSMRISDTQCNFYAVWVDCPTSADPTRIVETRGNDTIVELVLPSDLRRSKLKEHQIVLQKRTEATCGTTTIYEFITDGYFLQAEQFKSRQIEFIGDSYTCGYGVDAASRMDRFSPNTENASRTYASIVARYFDADYLTIAHSGRGICRNAESSYPWELMPDLYQYTIDRDSTINWSISQSDFRPDITIIYLGANDFSGWIIPNYNEFRKGYIRLLEAVKSNYGNDHPILCMTPGPYECLLTYVREVVNNCGMDNVYFLGLCPAIHDNATDQDLGAGWHPNYNGQLKIAYSAIPYIATITGWGLQDNPVK